MWWWGRGAEERRSESGFREVEGKNMKVRDRGRDGERERDKSLRDMQNEKTQKKERKRETE